MSQKIKWKITEVKGARGRVVSIDRDLRLINFDSEKGGMRIIPIDSLVEIIGDTGDTIGTDRREEVVKTDKEGEESG